MLVNIEIDYTTNSNNVQDIREELEQALDILEGINVLDLEIIE